MIPIAPPTDNLYKFMAVFGLLLLAFGILNIVTQRDEFIREKVAIASIENEVLDSIEVHAIISPEFQSTRHSHDRLKTIKSWQREVKKVRKLAISSTAIPNDLTRQLVTDLDVANERLRSIKRSKVLLELTMGLGLLMMILGFWFWYQKDQRWVDEDIRKAHKQNNTDQKGPKINTK